MGEPHASHPYPPESAAHCPLLAQEPRARPGAAPPRGGRTASRRWRPEPELSPLHKIPTLRPWLATRDTAMEHGAHAAG